MITAKRRHAADAAAVEARTARDKARAAIVLAEQLTAGFEPARQLAPYLLPYLAAS